MGQLQQQIQPARRLVNKEAIPLIQILAAEWAPIKQLGWGTRQQ